MVQEEDSVDGVANVEQGQASPSKTFGEASEAILRREAKTSSSSSSDTAVFAGGEHRIDGSVLLFSVDAWDRMLLEHRAGLPAGAWSGADRSGILPGQLTMDGSSNIGLSDACLNGSS